MTLRVSKSAREQADAIEAWWQENRRAAPSLFRDELAAALSTIELFPAAGRLFHNRVCPGVRRYILRATRHHVYYMVDDRGVLVMAIWSAVRGRGPDLRQLV